MADGASSQSEITNLQSEIAPSAFRAWAVLVVQSFQRHWRVRQMGWVSLVLLALVVSWVAVVSNQPGGWGLPNQRARRGVTYRQAAEQMLPHNRYDLKRYDSKARPPIHPAEVPNPFNPTKNALQSLILSVPHAVMQSEKFLREWAFMNYSRWVILGTFLGFVLPLFTLSYASAAFGTDRESRSLVWLMTRPIPRSGIYLAKFLGTLPWCMAFGTGGFVALCLAGGERGREALALYWPPAVMATVTFAALFHLIGSIFRRPVVVGLIYVFFFEALVPSLPGSLKLLSLTFYARSLMYNEAVDAGYPADMLAVSEPVSALTAWCVLVFATVAITLLGMWLFSRSEYRDDL
ncbi:MAG: ABC transporter permease [Planctomycetia bacterium]|nr:ABC transporter permease [Planctomycetia bacterium]